MRKLFSVQISPIAERRFLCLKVPWLHRLVLLVKQRVGEDEFGALLEWYWQGKTRRTGRKTCPNVTLPTINPTWTDHRSNEGLRGEKPTTDHLFKTDIFFRIIDTKLRFRTSQRTQSVSVERPTGYTEINAVYSEDLAKNTVSGGIACSFLLLWRVVYAVTSGPWRLMCKVT